MCISNYQCKLLSSFSLCSPNALYDDGFNQSGTQCLFQGALRVNRFNSGEGWVASESVGQDILIPDRIAINRALDGDIVAVELLDKVCSLSHHLLIATATKRGLSDDRHK